MYMDTPDRDYPGGRVSVRRASMRARVALSSVVAWVDIESSSCMNSETVRVGGRFMAPL